MKTLLVPVDFSDTSLAALDRAAELARGMEAELAILHADEFPITPVGEPAALPMYVVEEHENWVKERLEEAVERARRSGVKVRARTVVGPAHQVIVDVAAAEAPFMIVMGSHGRRGLRRLFVGSVTERVARTSSVPVLTVRPSEQQVRPS